MNQHGSKTPANGSTVPLPGYEMAVPCLSLSCGVCGWFRWGYTEDSLEQAYAIHLNDDPHAAAEIAAQERQERIAAYQLADTLRREREAARS